MIVYLRIQCYMLVMIVELNCPSILWNVFVYVFAQIHMQHSQMFHHKHNFWILLMKNITILIYNRHTCFHPKRKQVSWKECIYLSRDYESSVCLWRGCILQHDQKHVHVHSGFVCTMMAHYWYMENHTILIRFLRSILIRLKKSLSS